MIGELTNHVWQSTLFAVVVGLLAVALRRNRAQIRYWLWFSVSLKFFIPFSLLLSLGSRLEWVPAAKKIAPSTVSITMERITQPFSDSLPFVPSTSGTADWGSIAILSVWMCGFGAIALIRFQAWRRIRAAVRSSIPLNLPATVEVRSSPGLLEPGVVGLLRPILLLPAGIVERLTPLQLEAVLAHELCHMRRRDNLTAAIHMVIEAVFWFHPLVWWIGAQLVKEREQACDEEVLRLGSEPQIYAEAILNVCKHYLESPLVCVSGITGSDLKKRIEAIISRRISHNLDFGRKLLLASVGILAVAGPLAVGMLNSSRLEAQSSPANAGSPTFEVASIKQNKSGEFRVTGGFQPGGRYKVTNYSLRSLIAAAYVRPQLAPDFLIAGGPDWIDSDRFDVEAKAATDFPSAPDGPKAPRRMALQELLKDRFKLRIHSEVKDGQVYALTLTGKENSLGAHMRPSSADCAILNSCSARVGPGAVTAVGMQIPQLLSLLPRFVDRVVIDQTGLSGRFDLELRWTPAPGEWVAPPLPGGEVAPPADGPSIFTAVQEQLGLRLQSQRGPVETLVIDSVEKPSDN